MNQFIGGIVPNLILGARIKNEETLLNRPPNLVIASSLLITPRALRYTLLWSATQDVLFFLSLRGGYKPTKKSPFNDEISALPKASSQ
jgi:hypothetical protein